MAKVLDMADAPTDGTWIIGINEAGNEARIQSRRIHPDIDLQRWFAGEPKVTASGNWVESTCFYPVSWRPLD